MALCDGGIVSQPYQYYRDNKATYDAIADRLERTRQTYLDAPDEVRLRLLFDSATYALLTANTPLQQADKAFAIYREHYPDITPEVLGKEMAENGIGFYNMKATYIRDNLDARDEIFVPVDNLLVTGKDRHVQQVLMDARGIGPAKSAFTLAMLGFTDHACIDTHVAQYLGIDPRIYEKYSADEYRALADEVFSAVPDLRDEVTPFLLQWIVFDIHRGKIEEHDLWFEHVERISEGISA